MTWTKRGNKYNRENLTILQAAVGTWTITGFTDVMHEGELVGSAGYTKYGLRTLGEAKALGDHLIENGREQTELEAEKAQRIENLINEASELADKPFFSLERDISNQIEYYAAETGLTQAQWIDKALSCYLEVSKLRMEADGNTAVIVGVAPIDVEGAEQDAPIAKSVLH